MCRARIISPSIVTKQNEQKKKKEEVIVYDNKFYNIFIRIVRTNKIPKDHYANLSTHIQHAHTRAGERIRTHNSLAHIH
jgi:hypothetical protein